VTEGSRSRVGSSPPGASSNRALAGVRRLRGLEGVVVVKLELAKNGRPRRAVPVASTLVEVASKADAPERAARLVAATLGRARFPAGSTRILAPTLVRAGRARIA
jgi:hypothetical protein